MQDPNQQKNKVEEIDLREFFRWIGRGFNSIGNGVLLSLAGLRNVFFQNRVFFAGIVTFGLILGAVYSELLKKTFYRSSMVLSCDYLNTQILENTIQKLNLL